MVDTSPLDFFETLTLDTGSGDEGEADTGEAAARPAASGLLERHQPTLKATNGGHTITAEGIRRRLNLVIKGLR